MYNSISDGDIYEEAKILMRRVHEFFLPDMDVLYLALKEAYNQGLEDGKKNANV